MDYPTALALAVLMVLVLSLLGIAWDWLALPSHRWIGPEILMPVTLICIFTYLLVN